MATTATLGGLSLTSSPYSLSEPIDHGGAGIANAILTGDLRPEEYDQYAVEQRLTRQVILSINIRSGTFAQCVADTQALVQKLTGASRYAPIDFVFTPNGGNTSTMKVIGGSLDAQLMNQQVNLGVIRQATLYLDCLPWVYGAAQNLGSSGSPLLASTTTPATVTLSPSPAGDIPGDVTLFVRNDAIITQTVQLMTVNATGGSWKASYNGVSTSQPYTTSLTAGNVQTAIQGIVGSADVTVSGANGGPYTITFANTLAYNRIPLIPDSSLLTGGSHTMTITQIGTTKAPIRSLIAAGVSKNTTWVPTVDQSTWTLDAYGARASSQVLNDPSQPEGVVAAIAHFAAPTLPSDRRFRLLLAGGQALLSGGLILFRTRIVSGAVQATGEWRSYPQEFDSPNTPTATALADMGAWTFPVGEVGALGAQATTVYVEALMLSPLLSAQLCFASALFVPDDSMLVCETQDTSLFLENSGGYVRVESDSVYDSSGSPLGAVTTGSHIRTMGGRYVVATSQGFADTIDPQTPWQGENASVWASYTPRYIGLA